ncbi:MAG: hypothetical protein HON06_06405 [Candidatus Puniceispirillum sp.]|nr:hypothetical protein [Candidatus Puniceispirillum sp.]
MATEANHHPVSAFDEAIQNEFHLNFCLAGFGQNTRHVKAEPMLNW